MKITDEAKVLITEALAANDCNCLKGILQQSCCGKSLYFNLVKSQEGETPVVINGVPVLMDDEAQVRAQTLTITTEDGKLTIQDDTPSCCC